MRAERFELMEKLAKLPDDMAFFTQITMEAGEDTQFLDAMRKARIQGALVGVESVTEEGLKSVFKNFNSAGDNLAKRLSDFQGARRARARILHLWTCLQTARTPSPPPPPWPKRRSLTFAQFVMMTPFPGTVDFDRWEKNMNGSVPQVDGVPITRYWLIPAAMRPKMFSPHETMTTDEIRERTQGVWDTFYSLREIWQRSKCVPRLRDRLAFLFVSKLYRQMYANTGISTDSARRQKGDSNGALAGRAVPQVIRGEADAGARNAGFARSSGLTSITY